MLRMVLSGLLIVIAGAHAISAEAIANVPEVEEIVRRTLDRAAQSKAHSAEDSFAWTQHIVSEEFDDNGGTKKREERVYETLPISGRSYSRLVRLDGKTLSDRDLKQEQERERKFRQALQLKRGDSQEGDSIELNEELMSRFRITLSGRDQTGDRACFVLSFEPKGGNLPERPRSDKIVNRLRGTVWVDEKSFEISKLEAQIIEPVKMWGGLLGSIRSFRLSFSQTPVEDDVWLPGSFEMRIEGRALFKSINQRQAGVNTGFRRIS